MNSQAKTRLYLADIAQVKPEDIARVSPERAEKARRFRMPDDRRRSITAGLLLQKLLPGVSIVTNEYGKPEAENGTRFNLSHSGQYAAIAVGEAEVGVDLEAIRPVESLKMGKIVFCQAEMELLNGAGDRLGVFYDLWTKKEALLKCMGKGFHRGAKSVDVSRDRFCEDGVTYYFKTYRFSDYVLSVCSAENSFPDAPEFIDI